MKTKYFFKNIWKRCTAFCLALLMLLTLIPATVYKADDGLYYEATMKKNKTQVHVNLKEVDIPVNCDITYKTLASSYNSNDEEVAFCLDCRRASKDNVRYARTGTADETYAKLISYALYNPIVSNLFNSYPGEITTEKYAFAQALVWGYAEGLSKEEMAELLDCVMFQVCSSWSESHNAEGFVYNAFNYSNYLAGDVYVWDAGSSVQRALSIQTGKKPEIKMAPVSKEAPYTANEKVTLTIKKTDNATSRPLEGVTFDLYKDGVKVTTVTTDANGTASHMFTDKETKKAKSSTYLWCTNYNELSALNKEKVSNRGIYTSEAAAVNAAIADATAKAKTEAEKLFSVKHTYKAVETKTKTEYYLNPSTSTQSTTIASGDGNASITFNFKNTRQLGTITLTKLDGNTNKPLAGAVYGLYAKEDILHPDGTTGVLYKKDSLVATFPKTGADGKTELTYLCLGKYYVKEITAPGGYILSNEAFDVTLSYAGQNVPVTYSSVTVTDMPQKGSITLYKKDDITGTVLEGAVFELYAAENIANPEDTKEILYKKDTVVSTLTTDKNGMAKIDELPLGKYYLKEITAPSGYVLNAETTNVELSVSGNINVTVTAVNAQQTGCIVLTKKDAETDNVLSGAVFELYAAEDIVHPDGTTGVVYKKDALIKTLTTGKDGTAEIAGLPLGSYYLVEVTAPDGYLLNKEIHNIKLSYEGQKVDVVYSSISVKDTAQRGSIEVSKLDKELADGKDADIFDADKDNAQGDATIAGAVYGLYAKEDIVHPDGTIGVVKYNDTVGSIHEIKATKGTDLQVKNVKATAGTLIATIKTDENGEFGFENLYNGKYYIKEIKASEGYLLDDTVYSVDLSYTNQNETIITKSALVYEDVKKQAFDLYKVGQADGSTTVKPLEGIEFTVKLESDVQRIGWDKAPVYDVITTASDGTGSSIELPYGTYRVRETKTNPNYMTGSDFFVTVKEDSREHQSFSNNTIVNIEFSAAIKVVKIDSETGKTINVAGAEFKIKALTDVTVNGKAFKAGEYIGFFNLNILDGFYQDSWTTNKDGYVNIDKKLGAGKYQLEEITAPEGYLLDTTPISFEVSTSVMYDISADGETPIITVVKSDVPVDGQITVKKYGDVLVGFENGKFVYEEQALANAKFEIIAKEDIMDPSNDGTVLYTKGTVVDSLTTGSDGKAVSKNLPLGTYEVVEVTAPNGMVLNSESQIVELNYKDQNTSVVKGTVTFTNDRQKVDIKAIKKDSDTYENVEGAEITLYAKKDIVTVDGTVLFKAGEAIRTIKTDTEGYVSFGTDLPLSSYLLVETKAPLGYANDNVTFNLNANYRGQDTPVIELSSMFVNEPTVVDVSKQDITTGIEVEGNKLKVLDKKGNVVDSWTSVQGESHRIKYLHVGETYTLVEELAAYGYLKANSVEFTIQNTGDVQKVVMKDELVKGQITVEKRGEVLTGYDKETEKFIYEEKTVSGAVFEIYAAEDIVHPDNESEDFYKKGDLVATLTTGAEGKATTEKLPLGKYLVKEVTAPNGMVLNADIQEVKLTYKDQNTSVVTESVIFINDRQKVRLIAYKKDSDTNEYVSGAKITLFAKENIVTADGNVLFKVGDVVRTVITKGNGSADFGTDLPLSSYKITETKAPLGYANSNAEYDIEAGYKGQDINIIEFISTFVNEPTVIDISKQDITTGVEVEGNRLKVLDSKGNIIDAWTSVQGETHRIKYLHVGETYTLVEELAAYGYLKAQSIEFTIQDTGVVQRIVMRDELVKGQITVEKRGEVLTGYNQETKKFIYEDQSLAGAVFEIYAAENIVHPDNESEDFYKKGDLVSTLITGADGKATTEKLPLGKYLVKEVTAPSGMVLNTDIQEVQLCYADQNTSVVIGSATFVNERQKVVLSAVKKDADTYENVAGAEITLFAKENIISADGTILFKAGEIVRTVLTDESGIADFGSDLPLSTYLLKETKAPIGYVNDYAAYNLDATYRGQDIPVIELSYMFVNEPTEIDISKQDITTGIEVEGNKLQVLDQKGNVIDSWTSVQGESHRIKYLHVGETYTLVEELAAYGYLKANSVAFTIQNTGDVQKVVMKDELVKGQITVEKRGEVLTGYDEETQQFIYEEKSVAGAVYEVYAAEDIKHPDNESEDFYKEGELVATLTTGVDGKATTETLPLGKYIVKEVTAPEGMILNPESQTVELEYKDQTTELVFDTAKFINERQTVELDINKLDLENDTPLEGAEFTIYANKDIKDYLGNVIVKEGQTVTSALSDENGNISFDIDLPLDLESETEISEEILDGGFSVETDEIGNILIGDVNSMFYVKETDAPIGYATLKAILYLDTTYQGQDVEDFTISYDLYNEITRVAISKTDITTGEPVIGAQLSIYPADENGQPILGECFATWITEEDNPETEEDESVHLMKGLEPGNYVLREVLGQASEFGYVTAQDILFAVEDTGDIQKVVMEDDYTKLEISKTDITTGEPVIGAQLSIYPVDENGEPKLGECFATWITEEDESVHYIERIPVGTYILREVLGQASIYGYVTAQDILFIVEDTGEIQKVEMKDDYTKLEISKTDITTGEPVIGAQLSIYPVDENGAPILGECFLTWITEEDDPETETDESVCCIERIPVGTYVLREVLGQASELGYVTATDITFTVYDTGEIQRVEMVDGVTTVKITKVDPDGNYVVGATLSIVPLDEFGEPKYGETFATWITEEDDPETEANESVYTIERLPIGKYLLMELSAPEGYYKAESVIIEIVDTEEVQEFTMVDEFILTDIRVNKVDSETKEAIISKDFVFGLYSDKECTQLIQKLHADIKTGTVLFEDLRYGTYYVKEISAPEGYRLSSEVIEIIINDELDGVGNVYSFVCENTSTIKHTGDNYSIIIFTGISLMGLMLMGFAVNGKRKSVIEK